MCAAKLRGAKKDKAGGDAPKVEEKKTEDKPVEEKK